MGKPRISVFLIALVYKPWCTTNKLLTNNWKYFNWFLYSFTPYGKLDVPFISFLPIMDPKNNLDL